MISTYIEELATALGGGNAKETYFPLDKELRIERNLKLAREIGFGLKDETPDEIAIYIGSLYSRLLVRNCFDSIGVVLSAKEWLTAVREGMATTASSMRPNND